MTELRQALTERDATKPAEQQGVFRKFEVRRIDNSDRPGGKHHGCEYFVLDVDHDPHAKAALAAYARSCQATHPQLSNDMLNRYSLSTKGDASVVVEQLGRFGHHPDPAIDFCVEVDCLEGLAYEVKCGTADKEEVSKRIFSALMFRVGGDEGAVKAKQRLRELEATLAALPALSQQWSLPSTLPSKLTEPEPFMVLVENEEKESVALQVSWFEGYLYPCHLGGNISWSDHIDPDTVKAWMPALPTAPKQEG